MSGLPGPERWRLIAPILERALDLPPEQRQAFLEHACGGDAGLRREVEGLLTADEEAGSFLAAPVDLTVAAPEPGREPDAAAETGAPAGTAIGSYRIIREIGRGGMGVVYEAEQQRPRRSVALKVILGGRHVDAATVRMFQREADSLARLKHPGIAAIHEAGCTAEGQHFFAMELVQGDSLSRFLEGLGPVRSRQDLHRRLALFRKITAAVAYAHQRGVIHRDLKPSNIMVVSPAAPAAPGGDPDTKILDFGLARITDPDSEAATAVTAAGRIQGTLPYMSPDQIRGRRDEADARTDVYSLGVILYRILTGRLPYDLEETDLPEAARIICEQAPRPLRGAAGGAARFDHDLTVIVLKALEKEPARRYQTVAAFDEDIARYLGGQPILARPASPAYQIRKLVARHTLAFAAAAGLLVLLVGFAVVMAVQARRIAAERDRANREAKTALQVSAFLIDLFKVSDPWQRGIAVTAREILDRGVAKVEKELADEPEIQARLMLTMGNVYRNLGDYEKSRPLVERSLEMRRRLLGEENLETLESMNAVALLYQQMDRAAESEKLYDRLIEIRRRLQGDDHPDTLMVMSGLADVYWSQGRYADKEALDRRVLEGRRRVLGEDDKDTLSSVVDVAYACWLQGRHQEAVDLYKPALERARRMGDDHPMTLLIMHNLANVYDDLGRYAEAESLFRATLDADRRVLGDAHPSTLALMNDLSMVLQHEKRYAEAEALLREALGQFRRVLGEEHRMTMGTLSNLGSVLSDEGRHAEAEALLREALEKERRVLGDGYPDTLSTLYTLGCVAARRGDRPRALDWLEQAVAHGFGDADELTKNPDLAPLRADAAFAALVSRARDNARQ